MTCPKTGICGGCLYQGVPYQEQIEEKALEVRKLFERKGIPVGEFRGIQGSPEQYRYRNKMEYSFGDEVIGGEMTLGMHKAGSYMSIVTTDCCQIVPDDFNRILRAVLDFCTERGYTFYHKKRKNGLLRNLILRRGVRTGELLINLVTSSDPGFDEEAFVSLLCSLPLDDHVVGVLRTYNDSISDAILCEKLEVLYGRDYYEEEIMGLKFKVSAFSFFQTNVPAVETLYTEALSLLDHPEGKRIFDLYCGTGTISQALALQAKEVVGVELIPEAVEAAKRSAERNGLENCTFIAGDVLKVLDDEALAAPPDVIVVDPPRSGIHPKAWKKILNYGVKEILYISCSPGSLAVNLEHIEDMGYHVETLKLYDNFPFTKHTECVAKLVKKDYPKMVLFDLDGTLWDSAQSVAESWNQVLSHAPEDVPEMTADTIHSVMGKSMDEIAEILFHMMTPERRAEVLEACCKWENAYVSKHGGILYPKLIETLQILKDKGYGLAIVSNCQSGYIPAFLRSSGLELMFVDYEEWGNTRRPKGENILSVLQRNGAEKSVYVGDTQGDQNAANFAGVPFIHASYGFGTSEAPEAILKRFEDLPALLEAMEF
ncbi:MAG: 23S rRNA (uracil(1939)-C(5))-methyltransferase RlmD [Clostridiales bacterium]|nr:23S rRNA (uracil(1939)-C(5))-methyltransferase RlmD [Clostridiales bacterium]